MLKPQIIAFYLPQFYPTKENDEWWGKGFTEWTNVGKAKPLFKGHNQPRVPTELGYYDLRLPDVREQQAQMAREAGVSAFCYWHYWFGNGKRLLTEVFDDVLNSGKPDFPFCLGWANHSWYAKDWNSDGSVTQRLLIQQTYPGPKDVEEHFAYLVKAFKDPRYVKVDNAPLFFIFAPQAIPEEYLSSLRKMTKQAGFNDLFLVGQISVNEDKHEIISKGFNAVSYQRLAGLQMSKDRFYMQHLLKSAYKRIVGFCRRRPPFLYDYEDVLDNLIVEEDSQEDVMPFIVPQWDHTPRSGWNGTFFVNSTPALFSKHVKMALDAIRNKPINRQILFLKSWNEWGEGNYMEPDITNGRGFINALKDCLSTFSK